MIMYVLYVHALYYFSVKFKIETIHPNEPIMHIINTMAEVVFFTIMIVAFIGVMLIGYFAKRNNERN